MKNIKKMRGVIDPITLGFLISAIGAGAAIATTSTSPEEVASEQLTQETIVQVDVKQKDKNESVE